jgi:hypothetical protein
VWEQLCYIGPDSYVFKGFRDSISGLLRAEVEKVAMLRRLFGLVHPAG